MYKYTYSFDSFDVWLHIHIYSFGVESLAETTFMLYSARYYFTAILHKTLIYNNLIIFIKLLH